MANRTSKCVILLVGMLVAASAMPASADGAGTAQRAAQRKLLAYRAARADGIRKLAEQIRGLKLSAKTTVRDFVTESDVIRTSLDAYLAGVRESGRPRYMEDGSCEVTMEITLREVITTLKKFHTSHYKGNKVTVRDIEKINVTSRKKVISATGMGAPREEFIEEPLVPVPSGASVQTFSYLRDPAKAYWMSHCSARGRLMAVRAARVDAFRRLAERIKGVRITSQTTVRDFVAESDDVNISMNTFIRGAREVGIRYHADELIVEVELAVTLREVTAALQKFYSDHYTGKKITVRDFEKLTVTTKDKIITEAGMGVPPEKYLKSVTDVEKAVLRTGARAPGWISSKLHEPGEGALDVENPNKAQAKLMAYRAAELDARRKLAEKVAGLTISSSTTVQDFVTKSDEITTAMLTFQQGAHVLEDTRRLADGTAVVTVEIELKPLWNMVLYYQKKLAIQIK